ncbi:MAG: DNA-binding response regulator, partial [Cyclobacteriaceae bacterium]|nr:DNA-binding response regulator [Cyclobacteriaceae bacterium]
FFRPHDSKYQIAFKKYCGSKDSTQWKTSILIPILPTFFAALSSQNNIEQNSLNIDYFETIRGIFSIFLSSGNHGKAIRTRRSSHSDKKQDITKLSERQELILKMIKAGNTNMSIARQMGYSESLIRQETISIYRKLGISGRKDLELSSD